MFRPIEPISKACYSIAKSIQDLKRKLGIDKVDNTSDEEKPVSRPTQNMINSLAVDLTHQINEAKESVEELEDYVDNTYATKIQLTNGDVKKVGTATVGSLKQPIYLSHGTPHACDKVVNTEMLDERLEDYDINFEAIAEQLGTIDGDITTFREQISTINASLSQLGVEISYNRSDIARLNALFTKEY